MPTARQQLSPRTSSDPMYRLILVVDIEGSTKRTNRFKGLLRGYLYRMLDQALKLTGITASHLEPLTDRGDGALILIEQRDDVPKTLILGTLLPVLTALLLEHNQTMSRSDLHLRLRAVVHAGEVHQDTWGFYGDDIDTACRLLDTQGLRRTLEAVESPLVLAVSEEIFKGIVQQYYSDDEEAYQPLGRIRVGNRSRRGWAHVPAPAELDDHAAITWPNQVPPSPVGIASAS